MIILEGTDAVGKTTTIKELAKIGIYCQDRSKDVISKYMLFDYDLEYRANIYYNYLKNNSNLIIFLVNNDKDELMRRVYSREKISDFDLEAYEYNKLYQDTYDYMLKNNMLEDKLFLVDVTGMTINEQASAVKEVIICHQ